MTGVSTSNLTALAWMSSIWGWRYDSEAKAYNRVVEPINPVYYSSTTHLHDRVHEAICSRHVDQSAVVSIIEHASLSLCC